MLICLSVLVIYGCNDSAKSPVNKTKTANTALKELDKVSFLNMIDSVVNVLGKKNATNQQAVQVITAYHSRFHFSVGGDTAVTDTGNVFVNIDNRKQSLFIQFGLSENYRKQVSYGDLKKRFGEGKVEILPKEPLDIPVTFKVKGQTANIFVTARSKGFPEQPKNVIYDIIVSKL